MSVLNSAVRHATDGFIGILDMFGFEDPKVGVFFILVCFRVGVLFMNWN